MRDIDCINLKFKFSKLVRCILEPWMASNGKLMNTKFVPLIKTYIFSNGHIFI